MTRRRRRLFRAETVAPWATMVVIVGLWALGAKLLSSEGTWPGGPFRDRSALAARSAEPAASETDADDVMNDAVFTESHSETASDAWRPSATESAGTDAGVWANRGGGSVESALRARRLLVPVAGVPVSALRSSFTEARGGGSRRHEAIDILAPRGTAVLAVTSGRIAKLFTSANGGLTVYQFDDEEQFCYYYAHLDSYAPDLTDGDRVERGQVIGYVGTTGNAPADTPHLHFAIYELGPDKRWWEGTAVDPFLVLR